MKLMALVRDSFREIYAKKIILGIIIMELIALAITAAALFSDGMQEIYHNASVSAPAADSMQMKADPPPPVPNDTSLLGSDDTPLPGDSTGGGISSEVFQTGPDAGSDAPDDMMPPGTHRPMLSEMVKGQLGVYAPVFTMAVLFIGIFITAGIVPSMMEKGTVDLLLSKPLPRTTILFGRALGGFLALAMNVTGFVLAVWTLYGAATTVWHIPFLFWTIAIPLFTFLVLYSGIILLNVITESWVLPMSLAYVHLMILSNFLFSREELLFYFIHNKILQSIITGIYYILPQTTDMVNMVQQGVFTSSVDQIAPFVQGIIFMGVTLGLAAWKFQRKDF